MDSGGVHGRGHGSYKRRRDEEQAPLSGSSALLSALIYLGDNIETAVSQ